MLVHRRSFVTSLTAGAAALAFGKLARSSAPERSKLGLCVYALGNRIRAKREGDLPLGEPAGFLEACRQYGAGGAQAPLRVMDRDSALAFRKKVEESGMFVEGISKLPAGRADVDRFEAEMRTASECGARVVRVVMIPGRRYERYHSEEEFRAAFHKGRESLALGAPVAARHGVRLAVENHNDQRIAERVKLLEEFADRGVGACLDCANSLSLLESPVEVLEAYAPFALSVHLKDIVVTEYEHGFRYTDVALGDGILDLERIVQATRAARPEATFCLETITREPHDVPCLTDGYWSTFSGIPARDLARTLALVRAHAGTTAPEAEDVTAEEAIEREDEVIRRSLAFARSRLGL